MKQLMLVLIMTLLAACASPAATPLTVQEAPAQAAVSRAEAVAFRCPASESVVAPAPDDPNADPFGNGPWFVNADRSIWMPLHSMSVGGNKLVWIRPAGASGTITGKRLDGEAPSVVYESPGGESYRTGFEVGGLTFPTEGCWEVTATAGESALTFVVEVGQPKPDPTYFFFVRPEGERGPLVAFDTAVGNEQFRLPAGLLSADGQRFVTAQAGRAAVHDTITGRMLNEFVVDDWELTGLSPTGESAVFTRLGAADGATKIFTTGFKIVNTVLGEPLHELHLDGHFEFDAISADGKMLFLIERLGGEQTDQYVIRQYDLSHESLLADPIRSKGPDEIMAGYAWSGVGTADGEWLLTLYLSTLRNVAFVHALNLHQSFAVCIALPSGDGDFEKLKQYSLTLGPDGKTLYAANTALGAVAEVMLDPNNGVMAVTREAGFPVEATTAGHAAPSVLAKDGRLYFAAGETVWPYSTKTGAVHNPIRVEGEIVGLGANWNGSRLFVARAAEPITILDTASGLPIP